MKITLISKTEVKHEMTAKQRAEARKNNIIAGSPRLQKMLRFVSEFDSNDDNMEKLMYRSALRAAKSRLTLDGDIEKIEGSLSVEE